jgi:hypothetical protein
MFSFQQCSSLLPEQTPSASRRAGVQRILNSLASPERQLWDSSIVSIAEMRVHPEGRNIDNGNIQRKRRVLGTLILANFHSSRHQNEA